MSCLLSEVATCGFHLSTIGTQVKVKLFRIGQEKELSGFYIYVSS